jgi:hypothetical protein
MPASNSPVNAGPLPLLRLLLLLPPRRSSRYREDGRVNAVHQLPRLGARLAASPAAGSALPWSFLPPKE